MARNAGLAGVSYISAGRRRGTRAKGRGCLPTCVGVHMCVSFSLAVSLHMKQCGTHRPGNVPHARMLPASPPYHRPPSPLPTAVVRHTHTHTHVYPFILVRLIIHTYTNASVLTRVCMCPLHCFSVTREKATEEG